MILFLAVTINALAFKTLLFSAVYFCKLLLHFTSSVYIIIYLRTKALHGRSLNIRAELLSISILVPIVQPF